MATKNSKKTFAIILHAKQDLHVRKFCWLVGQT